MKFDWLRNYFNKLKDSVPVIIAMHVQLNSHRNTDCTSQLSLRKTIASD